MSPDTTAELPALPRVLIVEDLDDNRESLQTLLQLALNVEVDTAPDGGVALEMLAQRDYAVLITDLRMPRVSGMGVLREVRQQQLPCAVIVMTGNGSVKEAVEAMRLGANEFLTKPVDPKYMCLLVDRLLREHATRRCLPSGGPVVVLPSA